MLARLDRSYGPYRVVRRLGHGGMGTVLLAEDPRLDRVVALKVVKGDHGGAAQARAQLLLEARAAASLNHPNIAAVHDVLDIDGEVVIVFEYVEGETLATRLGRGRVAVADALRIAEQLADGLAVAHAHGVIHRDLKPANVMLTPDGRAKILDFGIAKHFARDSEETAAALSGTSGMGAGTPAYAAPEQWLGDSVGPHTDLFALGVLMFEMLAGRRPFDARSGLTLMQQVIEAPRPRVRAFNPTVPCSVDALIDSSLAASPSQRPASAHDVRNILRSIELDLAAPATMTVRRLRQQLTRRILTMVVLLALVGATVAMLLHKSNASAAPLPVVAVLPLSNSTGSPDHEYLAAGLGESLTTSLASLSGMTVVSRAAVLDAWRRNTDPASVANELGATYLVEGSVQMAGSTVRLGINLVRADRSVAWGDTVEGPSARVLELESRLAAALGRALSVQVSAAERVTLAQQETRNPDALTAYWHGRAFLDRIDVKGNADAALAAFDAAIGIDPNFAIAHAARGEALWAQYLDTRDQATAQEAIAAGTTALRLAPASAPVRYALAVTLEGTGRLDDAIDELQRALALQPNYDDARRNLGKVLAKAGRLDEAIAEYRKAIALRPNYAGHYTSLGLSLYNAARYDEAADAMERAVELQPDSAVAHHNLGTVYQRMGRTDDALTQWRRAIAIQPLAQTLSNIGVVHHLRGEYGAAVEAYQKAIATRPNSHVTYRNLGDAYARMGRRAEARDAYEHAIELTRNDLRVNPTDARALSAQALYLQKAARGAEARDALDQALRLAPADVDVWRAAAVVHALAGRADAALDALEVAIGLGLGRAAARAEEDFESLRTLPRFKSITGEKP